DLEEAVGNSHIQDTTARYEIESYLDAMEFTPAVAQLADHFIRIGSDCGYGDLIKNKREGVSDASRGVVAGVPTLCSMGMIWSGAHTLDEKADLESLVSKAVLAVSGIIAY